MATATGGGAMSPSSSPRLPSPPPIAEDQTGPQSPLSPPRDADSLLSSSGSHKGASRRIRPGTKAADMNEGPPLVELSEIESAFQLTEHLKALHHNLTHPPNLSTTQPINRSSAALLASIPAGTERSLWLYELCRFLVQKLNIYLTALFTDNPPCSAATCPEMRASEWQYLCAVHDPPKSCCAIDYCCHTLDWAANTLASPKFFPSRLSMGGDLHSTGAAANTRQQQERHLINVFRRVYRIFAHAWFQHREVFWRVEGRTGLYVLFKTVCDSYQLIPEDNYTIPPEAEGSEGEAEGDAAKRQQANGPSGILRRPDSGSKSPTDGAAVTARRHKHALSRGGSIVAPVLEENEDEESTGKETPSSKEPFPDPPSLMSRKTMEHIKPSEGEAKSAQWAGNSSETSVAVAAATAAAAKSGGVHHFNMSPVSPHAMSAADLMAAESSGGGPGPTEEATTDSDVVAKSEDAAKNALTKAEGLQAGQTEAADADAAAKTVQD